MIARGPEAFSDELVSRARAIRLVVTDWNGVLGDGQPQDQFSLRDGVAIDRLRNGGIRTAIIARDSSTKIARRAEALGLSHVFVGVADKMTRLEMITDDAGLGLESIGYIAADLHDLPIMRSIREVGLTGAPHAAPDEIVAAAHLHCKSSAGFGAFREFADWILRLRRPAP